MRRFASQSRNVTTSSPTVAAATPAASRSEARHRERAPSEVTSVSETAGWSVTPEAAIAGGARWRETDDQSNFRRGRITATSAQPEQRAGVDVHHELFL